MKWSTSVWMLLSVLTMVEALPSLLEERARAPDPYPYPKPKQDPFYFGAVDNLAGYPLGAIIRKRQLENNVTSLLPANVVVNISATWQFLYRTNDIFGAPAAASATLWVPSGPKANPKKLLSYQSPWDSPNFACVSSYELQNGYYYSPKIERKLPANLLPLSALNMGWYTVLPDHEGLTAALGSGLTGAYATLDGIRAALNSASFTGLSPSARIGMSGYSGGAPPTEFAAEVQKQYAPELNIVGAAVGGINPDSLFQLKLTNYPDFQFNNIVGQLVGLSLAYPNLSSYLQNNLNGLGKKVVYKQVTGSCTGVTQLNSLALAFKNPFTGVNNPIMTSVWTWGTTWGLRGTPIAPLYVYQPIKGALDESYPDGFVSDTCGKGTHVTYVRNLKSNHNSESIFGNLGQLQWMQDRFDAVPLSSKCTTVQVSTTTLAPAAATVYGQPIFNLLAAAGKATQNGVGI